MGIFSLLLFGGDRHLRFGGVASKFWFSGSLKEQGIFGLGASYSNLMLVGLPIISSGFGDTAFLPLLMIVSIHSATLFFIATVFVERNIGPESDSRSQTVQQTLKSLFIAKPNHSFTIARVEFQSCWLHLTTLSWGHTRFGELSRLALRFICFRCFTEPVQNRWSVDESRNHHCFEDDFTPFFSLGAGVFRF